MRKTKATKTVQEHKTGTLKGESGATTQKGAKKAAEADPRKRKGQVQK